MGMVGAFVVGAYDTLAHECARAWCAGGRIRIRRGSNAIQKVGRQRCLRTNGLPRLRMLSIDFADDAKPMSSPRLLSRMLSQCHFYWLCRCTAHAIKENCFDGKTLISTLTLISI